MRSNVVKITEVLPLALLDLRAKIATAQTRHPERLGMLYSRYCSVMKEIREEKDIGIEELSALSGLSEDFLEAAESMTLELTDYHLETLFGVYFELAVGEEYPGDFKRLATERLATPYPEVGSAMREIREHKELSVGELSALSGLAEDILEAAESGSLEMSREDLKEVRRIYWSLEALGGAPADYNSSVMSFCHRADQDTICCSGLSSGTALQPVPE